MNTKRSIYCAGLSQLLNILCSEKVKGETVNYLSFDNIYDPKRYKIDLKQDEKIAKIFCDYFSVKFESKGIYKCRVAPVQERITGNKYNYWFEQNDVVIRNGDLISANLLTPLHSQLKGLTIDVFSEGASGLGWLYPFQGAEEWNTIYGMVLVKYLKPILRRVKNKIVKKSYKIKKIILFGDYAGNIIKSSQCKYNIEVVEYKVIQQNVKNIGLYLAEKFSEIDYRGYDDAVIHITIDELSEDGYHKYAADMRHIIKNKKLLIKKHPRDNRDYKNIFNDYETYFVPEHFRSLPVELILAQSKIKLWSFISTVLLSVDFEDILFASPEEDEVKVLYKKEYWALIKLLKLKV